MQILSNAPRFTLRPKWVSPNADISLLDERLSPAFRSFSCSSMSRATHRDVFGRDIPRRNATRNDNADNRLALSRLKR
jgi:hypothetical protein